MYTEGASGVFVAVLVGIVGAIALSAAGLLVLREQTPLELVTPSATESVASTSEGTPASTSVEATSTVTSGGSTTSPTAPAPSATTVTATRTPTATPEPELEYVVVAGDGVEIIAARFGISADEIIERNSLQPPYTLSIGQVLIIPTDEQ